MAISDQLRKSIVESGLSANALAKATGMSQPTVSRFLSGDDIKLGIADRLAAHFGLTLSKAKEKTTRRK